MRDFESDVDRSGVRDGRDRAGTGRGTDRPPGALPVLAGLLLLTGCGGGDDDCVNCPNGDGNVETLNMAVGEVAVRDAGDQVLALELPSGSEGRVYDVAVQVDSRAVGTVPVRLRAERASGAGGSVAPSANRGPAFERPRMSERWTQGRNLAMRMEIQENAKRLLRDRNVRPARRAARTVSQDPTAPRFSSMLPTGAPSVGDTLDFWYPVQNDFNISCDTDSAEVVAGEVKAVGQRAIMVEDTTVNSGLLAEPMNYDSLAQAFDEEVFGTDVAYFGELPDPDLDGNDRTYVLLTNAVNQLSDPEEEGIVTGFFLPTDLADSGDPQKQGSTNVQTCPASNEAEVLYLLAPDPDGSEGDSVSVATAKRSAGGTSSHEFQHLLNAANRVIKQSGTFADLEDTWLDEGLSHVAEEVVGLGLTGDPVRSNLTLADVTQSQPEVDAFNTFHLPNFARVAEYMRSPQDTRALAGSDPGGLGSLKMRGFAWTFLRWLVDQEATASAAPVPGSGEEAFVRDLAQADGGLETGIGNIEAASGASWTALLEDFGLAPAVDDTVSGVDPRLTLPTWDLRDVYLGLHNNKGTRDAFPEEYPLDVTANGFAADTVDFEVQGATQKYFRFDGSGASGSVVIRLSNQSGAALGASSGARLLIVRTR